MTTPTTTNEAWGFWGTMGANAEAAWSLAITKISESTNQPLDSVALFLDSVHGRHFADDVNNEIFKGVDLKNAIEMAAEKWMGWAISKSVNKYYGIPKGMPYLVGFVIHSEIVNAA